MCRTTSFILYYGLDLSAWLNFTAECLRNAEYTTRFRGEGVCLLLAENLENGTRRASSESTSASQLSLKVALALILFS